MDIKPENFHCVITASPVTTVTHHPAACAQSEQLPDIVCVCVCVSGPAACCLLVLRSCVPVEGEP